MQRRLLGTSLAMVFQDPMTSFNPTRRIGGQLAEVAVHHQGMSRREAMARAVDRLDAVRIPDAEHRARQYPHEFSGGMRQRAMIGMGLMGTPALIVADEPTTALDVTVQQQVLDLLAAIRDADDVALVLISHDVTVVGEVCDRVLVMYAGRIVEDLPAAELATAARHPYTRALAAAVPRHGDRPRPAARDDPGPPGRPGRRTARLCVRRPVPARRRALPRRGPAAGRRTPRAAGSPAGTPARPLPDRDSRPRRRAGGGTVSELRFDDVTVRYGRTTAVDGVSLVVPEGQVVGLVGESGSGKSTLARAAVGLAPAELGQHHARRPAGADPRPAPPAPDGLPGPLLLARPADDGRRERGRGDAARQLAPERRAEVARLLDLVHLDPALARSHPARLSGGQRQRVALARALAGRPQVVLADEITSALDVSIQGAVLNLVRELQRELGLSILFISHNLAVVRYVASHVAVMHQGRIVEQGPTSQVLADPAHDYTRELLAAVPGRRSTTP